MRWVARFRGEKTKKEDRHTDRRVTRDRKGKTEIQADRLRETERQQSERDRKRYRQVGWRETEIQ